MCYTAINGQGAPCPYGVAGIGDNDDSMNMIGHYYESIKFDIGAKSGCREPFFFRDVAQHVQVHFAIGYFTKTFNSMMRADGDEIRA